MLGDCAKPLWDSSNFPCKQLTTVLASLGIQLHGLPYPVTLPDPNAKVPTKKKSKGFQGLGGAALTAIVNAICDRENPHPLRFVLHQGPKSGKYSSSTALCPTLALIAF